MFKLLIYLKRYKKETVLGPLFKLLEASFELFVPLVMAAIIDDGIERGEAGTPYILRMGLVLLGLALIGLVCSITAQYFSAKAAVGFAAEIKSKLFGHIQNLSFSELDEVGTSTFITRMTSDINQVQTGVNLTLRLFLRSPFIVFGAMVMAFTIDVKSALIFAVIIPCLSVVVFGIMLFQIPMYKKVQMALDRVLRVTRENLTGVRVIRAFHREQEEIQRFSEDNDVLYRIQVFTGKISALMNPLTYLLINAALIVLIRTGALRVDSGVITTGELVALVNYMSQILTELVKLANLIINITKAIACGNRIQAIFQVKNSMVFLTDCKKEEPGSEAISFDHVSFRYPGGGEEVLKDVSFSVGRGQTLGIIGGTGSGKSTLVHLIARFYDATEGTVRIGGIPVKDYSATGLRKKIAVVMQKAVLFQGTIRSNLLWGSGDASDDELWRALEIAQAKEVVEKKEKRLEEPVEQGGKNFSGGQKQRLTIARALVAKPEILILDDSASALDYATDAALRRVLKENACGMTTVIVSQRTASIRHADQILVLDDGRLLDSGTHETLLETCPVYREIYESQFQTQEEGEE